jgi:hypothetical protein
MGLGEWVKKGYVTFALATSKVEKDAFAQNGSEEVLMNNIGTVQPFHQSYLMRDLKQGQLTERVKEFRSNYYKILKESEKYKFKWGNEGDFMVLTEQELKDRYKVKGDPYDTYPVEISVENKKYVSGLMETNQVNTIKVNRVINPRLRIEDYTVNVHIRDIDGKNKLLDFYIPENSDKMVLGECLNLLNTRKISDFCNFTNMSFVTPGGDAMEFSYKMLAFDKVVNHNGNYIIKMFAECVIDGRWVGEKYIL